MSEAEQTYLQDNQPEGVPPLELTGERTLPDVPEENYWYRRHVAVYEWIAERCAGLRVVDLACGEGYGSDLLAGSAAEVIGVDANPEAYEHARARYRRAQPELPARPGRGLRRAGRRRGLPADDRAHPRPRSAARADRRVAPVAYISTPNRLTLAPPGRREVGQPLAPARVRPASSTASCSSRTSSRSSCSASSTRASCGPTSSPSASAGTASIRRSTSPSRSTTASSRRSAPGTSACGPATWIGRWTSSRSVMPERTAGDLAIVLHSHMPYVEGFGTYPFGEEWLFDAFARSHLPVLDVAERLTMTITPVLADQLEAEGVGERMLALPPPAPGRGGRPRCRRRRARPSCTAARPKRDHYTRAPSSGSSAWTATPARLPGVADARDGSP